MPRLDPEISVLPVDTAISGEAYMPGLSNPVTAAEVKDIYMDGRTSVTARQDALGQLRREMVARDSADTLPDTKSLIAEIDAGLAYLSADSRGSADPDVLSLRDTAVNPENL